MKTIFDPNTVGLWKCIVMRLGYTKTLLLTDFTFASGKMIFRRKFEIINVFSFNITIFKIMQLVYIIKMKALDSINNTGVNKKTMYALSDKTDLARRGRATVNVIPKIMMGAVNLINTVRREDRWRMIYA